MVKKAIFMLAMLACALVSCSDGGNEDPVNPTPKPEEVNVEITIDSNIISNGLSFGVASGEQTVSFSVNTNWTLSVASTTSGATWCKASTTSGGKGTANVKFTVDENMGYDDRSVSVTIKAGTVSKTFTITQKGADALLVTTNKYEVAQEGGKIEVEVKANINYELGISETAKNWITESNSRTLTTYKHTFEIAANEEIVKREGEITFKSGDKVETVKVYQAGGAILLLSQNNFFVGDAGETISIEVKSNVEYGVQMPDVDWIADEASSRGMSSHTLKYVIAPNEGYDTRAAEIIFFDKNSDLKDTLKLIQSQKDAILLSNKEIKVKSKGETLEVKLSANVDFEMILPDNDWISESSSRALVEYKKYIIIAENKSESKRESKVVFRNVGNKDITDTLHIVQSGVGILQVTSKKEYKVDAKGDEISVRIKTNDEYDIIIPEIDWIKRKTESRATSYFYEDFEILANETFDERKAQVIFKGKMSDESDTITVIQEPKSGIVVSKKEYSVKAEKDTISVIVSSNVTLRTEITSKYEDWIEQYTPTESRALNDSTFYFIVAENKDYNKREGYVLFKDKDNYWSSNAPVDTIKIIQEGRSTTPSLVLNVSPAGSLNTLISSNRKEKVEEMKLTGELNGTDFVFMKGMSNLKNLDLSEATIVEGGDAYYHSSQIGGSYSGTYVPEFSLHTKKNSIIGNMFPSSLQVLTVPKNLALFKGYPVIVYKRTGNRIDGWKDTPNGSMATYVFNNKSKIKKVLFPEDVTLKEIGECSFYQCYNLYEIELPNSIEKIGENAFNSCYNLTTIKIPNNVKEIGAQAFYGNSKLTSINLPDKLTYIADSLFYDCKSLSNITIPKSVTKIDSLAFVNCGLISINIPNNVKHISSGAFMGCRNLTSITLPNTISTIEYFTFGGTGISTINIPSNITEIQAAVFYQCTNLEKIILPDNVKSIGYSIFQGCENLKEVSLPSDITCIPEGAFKGCSSLSEISIPSNVTEIKQEAFYDCNIQSLTIPDKVETIGYSAFYNNKPMNKIVLGSGLKSVEGSAFAKDWGYYDEKVYYIDVTCKFSTPAKVSSDSFSDGVNDETKLYIPKGTYNSFYLSDWANIFDKITEL